MTIAIMTPDNRKAWAARIEKELLGNILPFWMRHTVDRENGGFYGTIGCDLQVEKESPRAAVINARILWTYSDLQHTAVLDAPHGRSRKRRLLRHHRLRSPGGERISARRCH